MGSSERDSVWLEGCWANPSAQCRYSFHFLDDASDLSCMGNQGAA